jgi:anaerobic sulfite reductase subunit A
VKLHSEPDDHAGLEMAFLAHLAQLGLTALEQGDEARLAETLEAQREFLSAHPWRWMPVWCDQVVAQAHTDFYRGVARLTRGALTELASVLETGYMPEAVA